MSITLRAKRILTGALAGAMVLGLLPAGVASAATTACQGAASGTFTDSNPTHQANIDCIAAYNVVSGFANGTFGGSQNITRGQMATFIARFAATTLNVDITDIEIAEHTFTDVAGNVHADNIARIFGLNVTAGRTATTFAPNDTITRAEAATMLANAHVALGVDLSGVTPSTAFTDLGTSVHADNINLLAGAGVVSGKTATTFAPSASILRAEAATLLVRSITVLRSQNIWAAPPLVEAETNQAFSVTPAAQADRLPTAAYDAADPVAAGYRDYSINVGAVQTVNLALADPENVTVGANGFVTFETAGTAPSQTADFGTVATNIKIVQVNGINVTAAQSFNSVAVPTGGVVTVRVSIDAAAGANSWGYVLPVAFTPNAGNNLPVNSDGAPANDFGVGGITRFLPPEATTDVNSAVQYVDTVNNFYIADNKHLNYSSADTFQLAATALTLAEFEAHLSVGDNINATYSQVTTDTFQITADKPGVATNVAAALMDISDPLDGIQNAVRVTLTAPANFSQNAWTVEAREVGTTNWVATTQATVGTAPTGKDTSGATISLNVTEIDGDAITAAAAAGDWQFRVIVGSAIATPAAVPGDASTASNVVTVPELLVPTQLVSTQIGVVETGGAVADSLDAGDVITVTFGEVVTLAANASVTVRNATGGDAVITRGVNSTWTRGPGLTSAVITLTDAPDGAAIATDAKAQVVAATGISGESGSWNLAGSGEHRQLAGTIKVAPAATASAATNVVTVADGGVAVDSVVRVYTTAGVLLGTSAKAAGGSATTVMVGAGLTLGQELMVVEVTDADKQESAAVFINVGA